VQRRQRPRPPGSGCPRNPLTFFRYLVAKENNFFSGTPGPAGTRVVARRCTHNGRKYKHFCLDVRTIQSIEWKILRASLCLLSFAQFVLQYDGSAKNFIYEIHALNDESPTDEHMIKSVNTSGHRINTHFGVSDPLSGEILTNSVMDEFGGRMGSCRTRTSLSEPQLRSASLSMRRKRASGRYRLS